MELELEQEKVDLIRKVIRSDKKYTNNEDLFEDFFNETYKRSFLIIKSVKNPVALESYVKKIATTSILTVLKDLGRLRRTGEGFVPTQEVPFEEAISPISVSPSAPESRYAGVNINYDMVDLQDTPEEIVIKKEVLQTLHDAVSMAHNNNPLKQYMQLYQLRYVRGLKQKQIAQELNLSQSEVSKRLLELMNEVKIAFNKD